MNTEEIKSVFRSYLDTQTQYAIMLNGNWGSGKTFFWKEVIEKIVKEKKIEPIYISLNGVSSISALERMLFIKIIPFVKKGNKLTNFIASVSTDFADRMSQKYLSTSFTELLKGISLSTFPFEKYIVCFDDLERCQIPLKEVLGFINNYVEHQNLKVILLANENEIKLPKEEYASIKEKLIGRILNFEWELEAIIPKLFVKYDTSDKNYSQFLSDNKDYIIQTFKKYQQSNLRIISFFLETLHNLYPSLKEATKYCTQEVILFTIIICIEFKKGNLKSSEGDDFKGIDNINKSLQALMLMRTPQTESPKEKKKYFQIFQDTYLKDWTVNYYFYPSIYSFILSGYLNSPSLCLEIKNRDPKTSVELENYRKLIGGNYRLLSDEDFNVLSKSVLKNCRDGKYDIYSYSEIANFFYFFSEKKITPLSKEEITTAINEGLNMAKLKKEIYENNIEALFHFEEKNPDTLAIKNKIREIHYEIKKERDIEKSQEFVRIISESKSDLLLDYFEQNKVLNAFFSYINPSDLYQALLLGNNLQLDMLSRLLTKRYNFQNVGEYLYDDFECLKKLSKEISNGTSLFDETMGLRKSLFQALKSTIDDICERLKNTAKPG